MELNSPLKISDQIYSFQKFEVDSADYIELELDKKGNIWLVLILDDLLPEE
jgi:hypothetical protein